MKGDKKHISSEDFQRYLNNQMTDAERNAFERMLQKYPFEAEALEGLQQISPMDLSNDLKDISEKIAPKKRRNSGWYRAAAILLLLITVGVSWFVLNEQPPVQELAESKKIEKTEVQIPPSQAEPQLPEPRKGVGEKDAAASHEMAEESVEKKIVKTQILKSAPVPKAEEDAQAIQLMIAEEKTVEMQEDKAETTTALKANFAAENDSQPIAQRAATLRKTPESAVTEAKLTANKPQMAKGNAKVVTGKVISLDDSLPLPGVTIVEKATSNGTVSDIDGNFTLQLANESDSVLVASFVGMDEKEFNPSDDSNLVIGLEPSQLALDEVVAVGYGVQKRSTVADSAERGDNDRDAMPKIGWKNYQAYLDSACSNPEIGLPDSKVVVKLSFIVNENGEAEQFEILRTTDEAYNQEAIQIIQSGANWLPKIKSSTTTLEKISLRLVFKPRD
ncbi:carboxypeptidase-like regulatory domain-containing protein [Sunxiuqinia sp. A32]|uniref:carboxypeptidase-like regulatory domain-containing protein n=1 Tax=Sunxiuqinia sp. A32 TaxID=3461496 RepID=UPI0040460291